MIFFVYYCDAQHIISQSTKTTQQNKRRKLVLKNSNTKADLVCPDAPTHFLFVHTLAFFDKARASLHTIYLNRVL